MLPESSPAARPSCRASAQATEEDDLGEDSEVVITNKKQLSMADLNSALPAQQAEAPAKQAVTSPPKSEAMNRGSIMARQSCMTVPDQIALPLRRRLELTRFSFMSISEVNCPSQHFRAQIMFELRFPNGVLDEDLNAPGETFPKSTDGRLPRPPAGWFMKQIDIKNFMKHTRALDERIFRIGNDICISMRYEGDFFENMELEHFPFDMQELSIDLAINCRTQGNIPCDLVVAKDAKFGISRAGFVLHQLYTLDNRMTFMERLTGDDPPCYPTITISARVYRQPGYVVTNVILPNFSFLVMSYFQFFVPCGNQEVRLAVTLTLVLTANASKVVHNSMKPDISYLTIM